MASIAAAHDGSPTLQVGAERVNPGGTLEVIGDLKAEGTVALTLVAGTGGTPRPLGTASADHDGNFQAFVIVPADVPAGSYSVRARSEVDEASVPILVGRVPETGADDGRLPGQDEALAGTGASSNAVPSIAVPVAPEPDAVETSVGVIPIALVVLVAVVLAFAIGTLAKARSRRSAW